MSHATSQKVDAIRYGAMRELSAGLRHALMGELQSVQFVAELAMRLLETGAESARIREHMAQISGRCAAARATGLSMIDWLGPDDGVTTTVADGVEQCIRLAGNDWPLRGIEATTTGLEAIDARIPKVQFQELTVVALLVLISQHAASIDLDISAHELPGCVQLSLRTRPANRELISPAVAAYRTFDWRDIELLARAHRIAYSCEDGSVLLDFNKVPA